MHRRPGGNGLHASTCQFEHDPARTPATVLTTHLADLRLYPDRHSRRRRVWSTGLFLQTIQALGLVALPPRGDRLPRDPIARRDLADRRTVSNLQHSPVSLLGEELRPLTPLVPNVHGKIIENQRNLSSMSRRQSVKHVPSLSHIRGRP